MKLNLFSSEQLLSKILGLTWLLTTAIIFFFYPRIVLLLSQAKSETLAQILVLGSALLLSMLLASFIVISLLYSENKKLQDKDEYKFYFGARWRINRAGKTVYEKPFCNCPSPKHDPIECKLFVYPLAEGEKVYRGLCPSLGIHHTNADYIQLTDSSGKELTIEEAVRRIKQAEFGK